MLPALPARCVSLSRANLNPVSALAAAVAAVGGYERGQRARARGGSCGAGSTGVKSMAGLPRPAASIPSPGSQRGDSPHSGRPGCDRGYAGASATAANAMGSSPAPSESSSRPRSPARPSKCNAVAQPASSSTPSTSTCVTTSGGGKSASCNSVSTDTGTAAATEIKKGAAETESAERASLGTNMPAASSSNPRGRAVHAREDQGLSLCFDDGQSDQCSWGSASASTCYRRSPPLSPLSTAQKHMRSQPPVGLRNLGNTCFLNAAVQALAHCPLIAPFFLRGHFVRDLNAANPLGSGGDLAAAFAALLQQLFPQDGESSGGSLAPEDFYNTLCRLYPLVGEQRGEQQDAHEVMSFLLDALHEDLNRIRKRPPYVERVDLAEEELTRRGEERFAAEAWHDHLRRHRSVLVDLCQGQLRSQVRCCECGKTSVTFDPFLFLSLPLPAGLKQGGKEPIEAAIRAFCSEEKLDGDNRWGCPRCCRRVNAHKRLTLWKLPLLLLVHLKRFRFEASASGGVPRASKIEGEVSVPLQRLDLNSVMAETSPQRVPLKYDLFAAIDHVGKTASSGHYTATCRRADGWWRFDDSRTLFVGEQDSGGKVVGEGNYLLLFQRRDAPPEPELVREQSHRLPENWPHVRGENIEWSFLNNLDLSISQRS